MSPDENYFGLAGRTAVVAGATRNLGRACALELARLGANVVVVGRAAREDAEAVVAECSSHGVTSVAVLGDVADPGFGREILEQAALHGLVVDISINCVGIRPHQSFFDTSFDDWTRVIETNLSASFYLAKAFAPGMAERGWGRIIHVGGGDGWVGMKNRPHNVTAKYGLHGLSKALARELADSGVTVNTVTPGAFATTRDAANYPDWDPAAKAALVPVGRLGDPREFASLCAFLASDRAGYITGQVVHINGGQFMF